ncbi:hypothetical protein [Cellulomonas sp. P5_C5]
MEMWLFLGISVALLVGFVVPLWRVVRQDGLGYRPPPASHREAFARQDQLT